MNSLVIGMRERVRAGLEYDQVRVECGVVRSWADALEQAQSRAEAAEKECERLRAAIQSAVDFMGPQHDEFWDDLYELLIKALDEPESEASND